MNNFTIRASKMVIITVNSTVIFTEGLRMKTGTVIEVCHDHYRIAGVDGLTRRILKERVEALTLPQTGS